jgi:hypothetical protein
MHPERVVITRVSAIVVATVTIIASVVGPSGVFYFGTSSP